MFSIERNQALALKQASNKQTNRKKLPQIIYDTKLTWIVYDFEPGITLWVDVYSEETVLAHLWEVFEWSLGTCSR